MRYTWKISKDKPFDISEVTEEYLDLRMFGQQQKRGRENKG